jgi:hypothetical protein
VSTTRTMSRNVISTCFATVMTTSVLAGESEKIDRYQMNQLFQPSPNQLSRESGGFVYIYDGLTDKIVNKAMDAHADRIESMMFVNTKITDEKGDFKQDPDTGEILVEDDGC